jgi:hypothetical protein
VKIRAFGSWSAPITDEAEWIDTPTELACMCCTERFTEGDAGCIYVTGLAVHRECSLRSVYGGIGHILDHARYCNSDLGPDAGLTYRQSAWLVWRHVVHQAEVTSTEVDTLRKINEAYSAD